MFFFFAVKHLFQTEKIVDNIEKHLDQIFVQRDEGVYSVNTTANKNPSRWDRELTHLSRMEFPTIINWTIPFPF